MEGQYYLANNVIHQSLANSPPFNGGGDQAAYSFQSSPRALFTTRKKYKHPPGEVWGRSRADARYKYRRHITHVIHVSVSVPTRHHRSAFATLHLCSPDHLQTAQDLAGYRIHTFQPPLVHPRTAKDPDPGTGVISRSILHVANPDLRSD
ncbi:hypothetical protein J6590_007100 [Homalodisca vitripennis]|nr:hypothetical protein J6590_007100 [Homalodisca vitripennis]